MSEAHSALASGSPLPLLELASSIVEITTERPADQWRRSEEERPSLDALLEAFALSGVPAMTALGQALVPLISDELLAQRARRLLADGPRPRHEPGWLASISDITPEGTDEMVHVLGDGDNIMVGWRWPAGAAATGVVYVDHNLGTIVKDAFVLPLSLSETADQFRRIEQQDDDQEIRPIDPADARARIADAIWKAEITVPPVESDTWPACRPLVEWVLAKLPEGGSGYERREWPDSERDALLDRFVTSLFASDLTLPADVIRELADPLVWYGCDYGPGDPLRWSPVSVEIVLADWYERKVLGNRQRMRHLPGVLSAFVRFGHAERGIRAGLTEETVAAVDRWTPAYLDLLKGSPRSPFQGAIDLARMAAGLDPNDFDDDAGDDDFDDLGGWSREAELDVDGMVAEFHRRLGEDMGGPEAIARLDAEPLPDEPFDWSAVPESLRAAVGEVLENIDQACDAVLDDEMRTISRRLLARLVTTDPSAFSRSLNYDRLAAGIVAVACVDNGVLRHSRSVYAPFGPELGIDSQKGLAQAMGVPPHVVSQRLSTVRRSLGLPPRAFDAELAHSSKRSWYLRQYETTAELPPADDDG